MNDHSAIGSQQPGLTLERSFPATPEEVWELWATPSGLESWWGPAGFQVTVQSMDFEPGGELRYLMTAVEPEIVAFLERSGMPAATEALITYLEVEPFRRLRYAHLVDFVPDHEPYEVAAEVEFAPADDGGTTMVLKFNRYHDDTWTDRARAGWLSQLDKLANTIAARAGR